MKVDGLTNDEVKSHLQVINFVILIYFCTGSMQEIKWDNSDN